MLSCLFGGNKLPTPTKENPFAQIKYVFEGLKKTIVNRKTSENYSQTLKVFEDYLADHSIGDDDTDPYYLTDVFCYDLHFRFYKWTTSQTDRFNPGSARGHLGRLRKVINYALAHDYIHERPVFVTPKKWNYQPTTEARTAYDLSLLEVLRDVLDQKYRRIKKILDKEVPHGQTLKGRDPRELKPLREGMSGLLPVLEVVKKYSAQNLPSPPGRTLGKEAGCNPRYARIACKYWAEKGVFREVVGSDERNRVTYGYSLIAEPNEDMLRDADPKTYGWKSFDNLVWYIFNVLDGVVPQFYLYKGGGNGDFHPDLDPQMRNALLHHGGVKKIHRLLEDRKLFLPSAKRLHAYEIGHLIAKLAMITGLNAESVASLKIDCIKTEMISGKPCLQYKKLRSTGMKALTLFGEEDRDLYSDSPDIRDGSQSILFFDLLPDASQVQDIVNTTIRLTSGIRKKDSSELDDRLFIYEGKTQSRDIRGFGGSNRIAIASWTNAIKRDMAALMKKQAKRRDGLEGNALKAREKEIDSLMASLLINFSRFRSTLATELVLHGAPIEVVQAVLGHRHSKTTKRYLAAHKMEVGYYKEVTEALDRIKNNRNQHIVHVADEQDLNDLVKTEASENSSGYIFETGTPLFCRNPYQPSEHIKKASKGWVDGVSTCHHWNKCLFCENVIIVDFALPKLIAYQEKLKFDQTGNADDIPGKGELLAKTISLIDKILDPESGFFDEKTVADARVRASVLSLYELDQYFYEGVGAWM